MTITIHSYSSFPALMFAIISELSQNDEVRKRVIMMDLSVLVGVNTIVTGYLIKTIIIKNFQPSLFHIIFHSWSFFFTYILVRFFVFLSTLAPLLASKRFFYTNSVTPSSSETISIRISVKNVKMSRDSNHSHNHLHNHNHNHLAWYIFPLPHLIVMYHERPNLIPWQHTNTKCNHLFFHL